MVEWHLKIILYHLISPKFNFGKVERTMFQMVARHWELFFFVLNSSKCDLSEVEKALFQESPFHFELIYGLLTIPKYDFVEVVKSLSKGAALQCGWICTNVPAQYIHSTITIGKHYTLTMLRLYLRALQLPSAVDWPPLT